MNDLNRIGVPHGTSKVLGEMFHCSQPFVRKALRGDSIDVKALRIRVAAKERGGIELKPVKD
jgi:hypothetical protein